MGFHNIEKKNLGYSLLLNTFVKIWHNVVFYRKIYINHSDRIPQTGHLIFTPNHQNALLDALAPLCTINRQLVFLARSDIFKDKRIARILYFLKILPIFRLRDGYSSVKKNSQTFEKTIDVIKANNGLVILPEGDYVRKHQLRTLKKGFARIAFQTEEASNFSLDLKIVPVGLHYSNYDAIRGDLIINFGNPISVSDFYDLYKEKPAVAINNISTALAEALKPIMLDLPDEDYEFFEDVVNLFGGYARKSDSFISHNLKIEQTFVSKLLALKQTNNKEFMVVKNLVKDFNEQIKILNIDKRTYPLEINAPLKITNQILLALITFPFYIYGAINNLIPFLLTEYFVRKIKDENFKHSFRFVISLLAFVLFYLAQTILVFIFTHIWWLALLYAITLPLSWIITISYTKMIKKLKLSWKIFWMKRKKPNTFSKLNDTYQNIFSIFDSLDIS